MGVHCCAGFSLVSESRGLLFIAVQGLLVAVLLWWSMGSAMHGLSGCGSQALELRLSSCGTWA